jgi:chemotaxis protein methyltransferase CheR
MTVATDQFTFLKSFIFERSAIVLSDNKAYLVESRLLPVARSLGMPDVGAVITQLRRSRDRALEEKVVEAMTTNETLWFRDQRPFNALTRQVIPELMQRKGNAKQLGIWSAASSSGQELYSIALLIEESFPQLHHGWRLDLIGTDLSGEMVRKATDGLYSGMEVNRGMPASMLVRYFTQEGAGYRLNPGVRKRVRFQQMNLVGPWTALAPTFDVIMLRNVLIYFDMSTKQRILAQARRRLAPGGYLFLGTAESTVGLTDEFETVTLEGATVYRAKERN